MKKLVFSLVLIGTIVVSGLVGYDELKSTAVKEGDAGTVIFIPQIFNR